VAGYHHPLPARIITGVVRVPDLNPVGPIGPGGVTTLSARMRLGSIPVR
jgi:hypothetical protein